MVSGNICGRGQKYPEGHNTKRDTAGTQHIKLLKPTGHVMHQQFNLLKPTGHAMHQQFNIQQLYAMPTLYLCVLYLSENKQRLVPLIS